MDNKHILETYTQGTLEIRNCMIEVEGSLEEGCEIWQDGEYLGEWVYIVYGEEESLREEIEKFEKVVV